MDATTDAKMADLTVELDSEEEPAIDSPKPTNPSKPSRTMAMLSNLTANDSESDSDDAPVKIPRGKLVSRLVQKIDVESSEEEAEEDPQAAYERIKQQMMAEKNKVEAPKPEIRVDKRVDATNIVTDDEDDLPVRPQKNRKPMANFQRRATSAPSLSPASSRRSSPGLFVSPRKKSPALPAADSDSDSDDAAKIRRKLDLEERIKRAREKRKAQQAEERQKEQQKSKHTHGSATSDADSDDNGRRLTQQTRPTRKAGKKALEEMSRENQRINRNMQLAHQAKTKKKYSVKDLFKVMDYKQENEEPAVASPDPIAANSALISSDAEQGRLQDTPPTSPPSQDDHEKDQTCVPDESAIPVLASAGGKGKGRAPEFAHVPMNPYITAAASSGPIKVDNASVETKESSDTVMIDLDSDSDDGAEANVSKTRKRLSVFDRVPHAQQKESRPLLNLRHLAHLTGPAQPSVKGRTSMNNTELQISLLRKARQQAQRLQQEKIEDLRSRGIVIQTEEEREQEQLEIDNIVERAREANLRLAKKEKEQAKKDGKADDHVLLSSDESGDEDYVGSGEEGPAEEGEEAELELSGSEEEDAADDDMESGEEENDASDAELDANDNLLNQEAEEVGDEVEEESHNGEEDEMDQDLVAAPRSRLIRKSRNVILDEEDDEADDVQHETPQKQYQPVEPTQDDAMAAFGFDTSKSPSLGLTQVFAGTMANLDFDSQPDGAGDANPEENSLDFLRALPDTQPGGLFSPDKLVPNTQIAATPNKIESQNALPSQFSLGISQLILSSSDGPSASQLSELPEPTQDASFTLDRSATEILAPESTVDTVIMSVAESPVVKRKGRLHRRKDLAAQLSDDDDEQPKQHAEKSGNVFEAMKKAAKDKSADNFDKKTSWAKDVVEEQADESEDEYAGLGGASDDDSGEDDEEVAKMIDDESNEKVDERKIAAYYAYVFYTPVTDHANLVIVQKTRPTMSGTSTSCTRTSQPAGSVAREAAMLSMYLTPRTNPSGGRGGNKQNSRRCKRHSFRLMRCWERLVSSRSEECKGRIWFANSIFQPKTPSSKLSSAHSRTMMTTLTMRTI